MFVVSTPLAVVTEALMVGADAGPADEVTAKSTCPESDVPDTTALAATIVAPTDTMDAGAIGTSATPAASVRAVVWLSTASGSPVTENVTSLLATGTPAASRTIAFAL